MLEEAPLHSTRGRRHGFRNHERGPPLPNTNALSAAIPPGRDNHLWSGQVGTGFAAARRHAWPAAFDMVEPRNDAKELCPNGKSIFIFWHDSPCVYLSVDVAVTGARDILRNLAFASSLHHEAFLERFIPLQPFQTFAYSPIHPERHGDFEAFAGEIFRCDKNKTTSLIMRYLFK